MSARWTFSPPGFVEHHSSFFTFSAVIDICDCHSNATCRVTGQSYTCQCKVGFSGDGQTCKGQSCSVCVWGGSMCWCMGRGCLCVCVGGGGACVCVGWGGGGVLVCVWGGGGVVRVCMSVSLCIPGCVCRCLGVDEGHVCVYAEE